MYNSNPEWYLLTTERERERASSQVNWTAIVKTNQSPTCSNMLCMTSAILFTFSPPTRPYSSPASCLNVWSLQLLASNWLYCLHSVNIGGFRQQINKILFKLHKACVITLNCVKLGVFSKDTLLCGGYWLWAWQISSGLQICIAERSKVPNG